METDANDFVDLPDRLDGCQAADLVHSRRATASLRPRQADRSPGTIREMPLLRDPDAFLRRFPPRFQGSALSARHVSRRPFNTDGPRYC